MHFIRAIRFDNPRRSIVVIRKTNVLAGICGTLCPRERLCEGACLRNALEDPIRIGELQSFAAASNMIGSRQDDSARMNPDGPKVALIGAGPAGLGAAASLVAAGACVEIFEAREEPGGMLAYGIPEARMPWKFARHEIDRILDSGLILNTCRALGRDFSVKDLFDSGFEAVFLGHGLWKPARIPGLTENDDVLQALPFLETAARHARFDGTAPVVGRRCVIIGGGSVAMDCAETALLYGAATVTVVCLEGTHEMPATWEDITSAWRLGVQFMTRMRIASITVCDDGSLSLSTVGIEWRHPGDLSPSNAVDVPGSAGTVPADTVIVAIGQSPDNDLLPGIGPVALEDSGLIRIDHETGATSLGGIYAGGDCVSGGDRTVVGSMADGRRAGLAIARSLGLEVGE